MPYEPPACTKVGLIRGGGERAREKGREKEGETVAIGRSSLVPTGTCAIPSPLLFPSSFASPAPETELPQEEATAKGCGAGRSALELAATLLT